MSLGDFVMNRIIMMLILMFLVGCQTVAVPQEDPVQFHPPRPIPPTLSVPEWNVLTPATCSDKLGDNACYTLQMCQNILIKYGISDFSKCPDPATSYTYMALVWEDYLIMGQNMQVIIQAFKEYNALLCYYRDDLNELQCVPYKPREE